MRGEELFFIANSKNDYDRDRNESNMDGRSSTATTSSPNGAKLEA
jgi:hypothetical protein